MVDMTLKPLLFQNDGLLPNECLENLFFFIRFGDLDKRI